MSHEYCRRYGFDQQARQRRLLWLGLGSEDARWATVLHEQVIAPNLDDIVGWFYEHMLRIQEFGEILSRGFDIEKLKQTQARYLDTLGQEFETADYFEERLRVGIAHARVGVPLSLYECAYAIMRQAIFNVIPAEVMDDPEALTGLNAFIVRITALDMSLAIETYHLARVQSLEKALQSLAQLDAELRHQVATDALTGVASHGQCLSALGQALSLAKRNGTPLCIAMVDLDHFKRVNDGYGHQVGDDVLRDVAGRMQAAVRNFDTVGRYGGEEFLIIMDNADRETALEIIERVRQRVGNEPIRTRSDTIHITLSAGISVMRPDDNTDSLIHRADRALYVAKHAGRNQVVLEGEEPDTKRSGSQS